MAENERIARVETIVQQSTTSIERLQTETNTLKSTAYTSFSDVKESIIQLRMTSEAMARTQEALAGRIDHVAQRIGVLEVIVPALKHDIEKVDITWKAEKGRMLAYMSGIMFVITSAWAVGGSFVKTLLFGG